MSWRRRQNRYRQIIKGDSVDLDRVEEETE
jgi:hypothetical protein